MIWRRANLAASIIASSMHNLVEGAGTVVTWLVAGSIAAVGALLMLVAVAGFFPVLILTLTGWRTLATVVAETQRRKNAKFQFTDDFGNTHVVSDAVASWKRRYGAGQQVALIYRPDRPSVFIVDRFADKWGSLSFLFILGLLILLPCLLVLFGPGPLLSLIGLDTLGPLGFMIFGAAMLALGSVLLLQTLRFRQRAAKAVGIIVESEIWGGPQSGGRRRVTRGITVEFEDATGSKKQGNLLATGYRRSRRHDVGAEVAILYDTEHPGVIRFDSFIGVWAHLFLFLVGAPLLIAGLLLWIHGLPFD